jgi:site-specific DNA-methyltransferase (adenine-specific)
MVDVKRGTITPCVKPIKLCEYLAKLILPASSVAQRRILVPFSGSGSEIIGCVKAGWDEVIGVEMSAEYCAIAEARITHQGVFILRSPQPGCHAPL